MRWRPCQGCCAGASLEFILFPFISRPGQARPVSRLVNCARGYTVNRALSPPCGAPKCTPGLYRAESVPTGSSNLFIVAAARSSIDASSWIRAVFRTPPSSSSSRRALSLSLSASLRWITLEIQVSILIYEIPLYHDVTLFTNIREKRHLGII